MPVRRDKAVTNLIGLCILCRHGWQTPCLVNRVVRDQFDARRSRH
jgi:hypothetical protein